MFSPNTTEKAGYVRSLDGVRGVAVLLVVLFHLRVWGFEAGFLGVDVFFVLSGFLITTLMLGEASRNGRISLPAFWARRARRLLPALLLVLLVVAASALIGTTYTERASLRGDLLSTAAYVANWHLIDTSSYFTDIGLESPLEHTWSLAIEEQFYLLWPLAVGGLVALARRPRFVVGVLAAVAAGVSVLLLASLWDPDAVERAYMGTDSRVFEPLLGALGAVFVASPWIRPRLISFGPTLAAWGATGLVAGVWLIRPEDGTYHRGGALFVSVMTLILVAPLWVGRAGPFGRLLSWRPLAWIGAISYGVYLWHWPVALWVGARGSTGPDPMLRRLAAFVLTVVAAALSYYLVERPIRSGLAKGRHLRPREASRARWTLAAVPLGLLAVAGVSVATTRVPPPAPGTPVVMLTGDSVVLHLRVPLDRRAEDMGIRFISAAYGGCPVTGETPVWRDGRSMGTDGRCPSGIAERQAAVQRENRPGVVLWWDRFSVADFLTEEGEHVRTGSERFWELRRAMVERTVDRFHAGGAVVLFVAIEPPGERGVADLCHGSPDESCVWRRFQIKHYRDITARWNDLLRTYALEHPDRASFLSITDAVCRRDEAPCDDMIDGAPARPDGTHYGAVGAPRAVEAVLDGLRSVLAGLR